MTFEEWKKDKRFIEDWRVVVKGHTWRAVPRDIFCNAEKYSVGEPLEIGQKGYFYMRDDRETAWIKHSMAKFDKLVVDKVDETNRTIYLKQGE